jgi:peptide/nickel transport system permease protein
MATAALPQTQTGDAAADLARLTPGQLVWRRFRKHKMAMFGLLAWAGSWLFAHGLCAPLGKVVSGEAYANCNDTSLQLRAPSREHPFGTDLIGQDTLARTIYGL